MAAQPTSRCPLAIKDRMPGCGWGPSLLQLPIQSAPSRSSASSVTHFVMAAWSRASPLWYDRSASPGWRGRPHPDVRRRARGPLLEQRQDCRRTAWTCGAFSSVALLASLPCLVLYRIPELEHLLSVPVAKHLCVALHPAPKIVRVIVEALPCCLPAHSNRSADRLPRGAGGDGLADQLGLPGGEQRHEGPRCARAVSGSRSVVVASHAAVISGGTWRRPSCSPCIPVVVMRQDWHDRGATVKVVLTSRSVVSGHPNHRTTAERAFAERREWRWTGA